jgi:alpha-glucosidase
MALASSVNAAAMRSPTAPPYGSGALGWLPQPAGWAQWTVEAESGDPSSMLTLYRRALATRRAEPGLGDGPMAWLDAPADVLAFTRGDGRFACVVDPVDRLDTVSPGSPGR